MNQSNQFYGNDPNQFARASILAGQTVRRLQRMGHSSEEAKRLVVMVINEEESSMLKGRRTFDEAGIAERLRRLPNTGAN